MGANLQSGIFAKITIGRSTLLAGASEFSFSGIARGTIEASEFGQDCKKFCEGDADAGTISVPNIIYDPHNTVQKAVIDAIKNRTRYYRSTPTTGLRFWLSDTAFLDLPTTAGAYMFATKAHDVATGMNALAKCSVEFKISGGFMDQINEYLADGAVAAIDTTIDVEPAIDLGTPQTGSLFIGVEEYAYTSWTGSTFTLAAACGDIIADQAVVRVAATTAP